MATFDTGPPKNVSSQLESECLEDADKGIIVSPVKVSDFSQTIANYFLDFVSTASNQQIIVILGGLSVAAVIIFGSLGFLLVGLVAGFLLRASWDNIDEATQDGTSSVGLHRKGHETGIEIANRLLDFPLRSTSNGHLVEDLMVDDQIKATGDGKLDFAHFPPATAGALQILTDAIIDNYVK